MVRRETRGSCCGWGTTIAHRIRCVHVGVRVFLSATSWFSDECTIKQKEKMMQAIAAHFRLWDQEEVWLAGLLGGVWEENPPPL